MIFGDLIFDIDHDFVVQDDRRMFGKKRLDQRRGNVAALDDRFPIIQDALIRQDRFPCFDPKIDRGDGLEFYFHVVHQIIEHFERQDVIKNELE